MPRTKTSLQVFVASPGDCQVERAAVAEIIQELNRTAADERDLVLEYVGWETHVRPGVGVDAQDVVWDQIKPTDVMIAILATRLGTPTERAASGTVEELEAGLELKRKKPHFELQVYCRRSAELPLDDPVKLREAVRVADYRSQLAANGVLYREYGDSHEFEQLLRQGLTMFLRTWTGQTSDTPVPTAEPPVDVETPGSVAERLTNRDPVIARTAMTAFDPSDELMQAMIDRGDSYPSVAYNVRSILQLHPATTAPPLVASILEADSDWHRATSLPDWLSPAHAPYAADNLAAVIGTAHVDATRKAIEALGFLGSGDWMFRIAEVFDIDDGGYFYEKYSSYCVLAIARIFSLSTVDHVTSLALHYLTRLVDTVDGRSWHGILKAQLMSVMASCQPRHADQLIQDWIESDSLQRRRFGLHALGQMRLRRATRTIDELISHSDGPRVPLDEAALALANIGGSGAYHAVSELARAHEHSSDTEWINTGLALALEFADESEFERDILWLQDRRLHEAAWMARAIGLRGSTDFSSTLREWLEDAEPATRGSAALALARTEGALAVDRLKAAHRDAGTPLERTLTSLALLHLGHDEHDPNLLNLRKTLADESVLYRRQVQEDVITTCVQVGTQESAAVADAWRPIYESTPDY